MEESKINPVTSPSPCFSFTARKSNKKSQKHTYFWEQGCHFCHCHVYSLRARYIAVMLVLLCCTQQFLNILSDLLSLPNHIFCTGQTGAGGCVGVLRDGPLSLPNDTPLPSLPARPRLLQLQRGSGVIIVALRHTALLFQLRGLQQRQICFSTMQERRAPRRVQALHPMYVVCPSARQPLHLLLLQSPVHLAVPRSTGRRSDQLELRPTAE